VRLIPRTRGGMLWRFALGALIVIGFTAGATAVAGLLEFKQAAADLGLTPALPHADVTIANPGNPQTILVIGSDHRVGTPWKTANTDTLMLVRLNPNSSTINVISIPRDLKVQIPQGGAITTQKINAAYSIGGPNLLLHVLRSQVFAGLHVNHIIDVNFSGFEALVDAIGCVYADVDHRYYNNTAYTNYSSIDLQPGYQKLCDADALAFVRFRHTDTDIVRSARQQDFIRWAKDAYGASQMLANRDKLLKIFGQHVQTDHDLHTIDGLINLFNLVVFSAGHTIKQIPFPAILLPCPVTATGQTPCYVSADWGAMQRAFKEFMTATVAKAPAPPAPGPPHGAPHHGGGPPAPPSVIDDTADGRAMATSVVDPGFAVYFPRMIAAGSRYCTDSTCAIGPKPDSYPRAYRIPDANGSDLAYRLTLVLNPALGQYYGVQGTTWMNPPILNSPTETRNVNGKQLLLYFNGHKLSVVAWKAPHAVYWISNTLTDDLSNQQMVAIAASLTPA